MRSLRGNTRQHRHPSMRGALPRPTATDALARLGALFQDSVLALQLGLGGKRLLVLGLQTGAERKNKEGQRAGATPPPCLAVPPLPCRTLRSLNDFSR
jgi:hypothetical protein